MAESAVEREKRSVATQVLKGIGVPVTTLSLNKLLAWFNQEGGNWNNSARYNPLNTTLPAAGAGNTGTQGNIKVYTSWQQGIAATVKTLQAPAYRKVVASLASGTAGAFEAAVNASPWGTHFPGGGNAVRGSGTLREADEATGSATTAFSTSNENIQLAGEGASAAAGAVSEALGFSWSKLGQFALQTVLVIVGAVLVIYGIILLVGKHTEPRIAAVPVPA